jgi:uncharacterized RDD family membrane protein YckC
MENFTLDNTATEIAVKRQGFGIRLGAWALDYLFIVIISTILYQGFGDSMNSFIEGKLPPNIDDMPEEFGNFMVTFMKGAILAGFVYFIYYAQEAFLGVTPGKMLVGIKIGTQDGTTATLATLFTRWIIKLSASLMGIIALLTGTSSLDILTNILSLIIFIGCFFVLGEKRQSFHDMISKTAVFKKSELK